MKIFTRINALRIAMATVILAECAYAVAVIPSTLRALGSSYEALSVGTTTSAAIDLMGSPKTRIEQSVLGLRITELTWVDIQQIRYQAKFASDRLVQKSSRPVDENITQLANK